MSCGIFKLFFVERSGVNAVERTSVCLVARLGYYKSFVFDVYRKLQKTYGEQVNQEKHFFVVLINSCNCMSQK